MVAGVGSDQGRDQALLQEHGGWVFGAFILQRRTFFICTCQSITQDIPRHHRRAAGNTPTPPGLNAANRSAEKFTQH